MEDPSGNPTAGFTVPKLPSMTGGRKTRKAGKTPAVGTKAQVYHGTAKHTSGGLTRKDLVKNKHGRIVSRKKMALGKKALKHLVKAGYKTVKGKFSVFHKKGKKD
jgi:hypothetical protein